MSTPSSLHNSLRHEPTVDTLPNEHIYLRDEERRGEDAEQASGSEAPTAPPTPGPSPLTKKLTTNSLQLQQSLKREWTKRKYAKYDRGRYSINEPQQGEGQDAPSRPSITSPHPTSYLSRPVNAARALVHRQRALGTHIPQSDTHLDILYENQRGFFLLGHPRYSASTLLPSDPNPWLNAALRTSPVDIRNAQVPDPSWEWVWKGWYVDMSRDVDEEGWEYRMRFTGGGAWHGTHPWFHSFVRRRRWVRLRRRRRREAARVGGEKAHELTAEYFTIHTRVARGVGEDVSTMPESELARLLREKEDEVVTVEKMEIADIGSLSLALKKSPVDREKLLAVRKFVAEAGGDELFYLSDRMEEIMSSFVFQSSRRQLLTDLLQHYDNARARKESLASHSHQDDEKGQRDHESAERRAGHLMRAVRAADEQVKRLEYWSDIKSMAQHGDTLNEKWDARKWQGLASPSSPDGEHPHGPFLSKQGADEGVSELHGHAEHGDEGECADSKGEGKAKDAASSLFYDARTRTAKDESGSSVSAAAYSTAAESVGQLRGKPSPAKSKGKARAGSASLDGVLESPTAADHEEEVNSNVEPHTPDEEVDPETGLTFMTPPERPVKSPEIEPKTPGGKGWWDRSQRVELVAPVAEDDGDDDDDYGGGVQVFELPSPAPKGKERMKMKVKGKSGS